MRVLVSAASRHGTTAEIAEAIADVLRKASIDVDVIAPEAVETVDPYDAVVGGTRVRVDRVVDEAADHGSLGDPRVHGIGRAGTRHAPDAAGERRGDQGGHQQQVGDDRHHDQAKDRLDRQRRDSPYTASDVAPYAPVTCILAADPVASGEHDDAGAARHRGRRLGA